MRVAAELRKAGGADLGALLAALARKSRDVEWLR